MSFQWLKNSAPIQGAKSCYYQTPATTTSDNGARYSVVVSNKTGSVTSSAATLTVGQYNGRAFGHYAAGEPDRKPRSASDVLRRNHGHSAHDLQVAKESDDDQRRHVVHLPNSGELSTSDNGAQFTVVATNTAGTATSSPATLTVNPATYLLSTSTTQLNFGSVNVSSTSIQTVTLTNNGNSNVTISNVTFSGAGITVTGGNGLTLSPLQKASIVVTFSPAVAGSVTGTVNVTSNAAPISIALSGTGLAKVAYSVSLNWTASASR